MPSGIADALATVRRPEYTGENRCTPCTLVNAGIAVVAAVVLAVLAPGGAVGAAAVGTAVVVVSAAVISLRGYLVPGTPWMTRTFLPDRVLRFFEHAGPAPDGDVEPLAVLEAADAVTECEAVDDLCLTEDFRTAWYGEMAQLGSADASRSDLAAMLDLSADDVEVVDHGDAFVARAVGADRVGRRRVGQWESPGAFLADMAGARVLSNRVPGWEALPTAARGQVLSGLRVFLDTCPTCDGSVTFGEETVESCCRSREVVAVTCEDCGDRLLEAEQPAAA